MAKSTKRKTHIPGPGDIAPAVRGDVYQRVTDTIIAALEAGTAPWHYPWNNQNLHGSISRPVRHNGERYRGINVLLLWAEAHERGYDIPLWMTYRQAGELGGQVRGGEKGTSIVYANTSTKEEESASGEVRERSFAYMKGYTVFNAGQIDGLPESYYGYPHRVENSVARDAAAEQFIANLGADIRVGGNRAYYIPSQDRVQIPPIDSFKDAASYYASLGHELVHWTAAASRCDRKFETAKFGDAGYCMEELTAELGGAFLCVDLELTPELRPDHASYIAMYLELLKADKRAVFAAASQAQKAVDYLHQLQPAAATALAA